MVAKDEVNGSSLTDKPQTETKERGGIFGVLEKPRKKIMDTISALASEPLKQVTPGLVIGSGIVALGYWYWATRKSGKTTIDRQEASLPTGRPVVKSVSFSPASMINPSFNIIETFKILSGYEFFKAGFI